jgi:hypothetical protein
VELLNLTTFSLLAVLGAANAQEPQPAPANPPKIEPDLAQLRDATRALPVFGKAEWTFDFDKALERAAKEQKPIFAYFTRSYAPCGPSTALENGVFAEPAFAEFGRKVVLFCHVTTRLLDEPDAHLLAEMGGAGYPYLAFLDAAGNLLARQGERSVAAFHRTLAACEACLALAKRAADGDATVAPDLLIARLRLGQLSLAAARDAAAELAAVDAQRQKTIDGLVFALEVEDLIQGLLSQRDAIGLGRKFAAWMNEGRVPTGAVAREFYALILGSAEADQDAATFAKALAGLRTAVGETPRALQVFERLQKTLDTLKGAKK